jgi:hypothetical protein
MPRITRAQKRAFVDSEHGFSREKLLAINKVPRAHELDTIVEQGYFLGVFANFRM